MKRRLLLRSLVALPAAAAFPISGAQNERTAARDRELPAGPALVPPGVEETPNTPVVTADQTSETVIRTFDAGQFAALSKLAEIIVPGWEGNPGAREVGAAEFLDFLVGCSPQSRIDLYKNGLDGLNRLSQQKFGKQFAVTDSHEADALLAPLREPWSYGKADSDHFSAFLIAAKSDLLRATANSKPYIDAISQKKRPRNASDFYWYPIS
jgi:hypothetical protein